VAASSLLPPRFRAGELLEGEVADEYLVRAVVFEHAQSLVDDRYRGFWRCLHGSGLGVARLRND